MLQAFVLGALMLSTFGCADSPRAGLIKIGLVAPLTGYDSDSAVKLVVETRAAIDRWNRGDSYRIELVALDDENDPQVALRRARELAADPDVVMAIARVGGLYDVSAEYAKLGLPGLFVGSPSSDAGRDQWGLRACLSAESEGRQAARYAIEDAHATKPVVINGAGIGYEAAANSFAASLGEAGARVSPRLVSRRGLTEHTALELAAVVADQAIDFVYFSGPYDDAALLFNKLRYLATSRFLMGSDAGTPSLAKLGVEGARRVGTCEGTISSDTLETPGRRWARLALDILSQTGASRPTRGAVAARMRAIGGHGEEVAGFRFDSAGSLTGVSPIIY